MVSAALEIIYVAIESLHVTKIRLYFTGSRFGDGFHMTRSEAVKLQSRGIHIASVCTKSKCDKAELLALASYPKKANTIFELNGEVALSATLNKTYDYLEGEYLVRYVLQLYVTRLNIYLINKTVFCKSHL